MPTVCSSASDATPCKLTAPVCPRGAGGAARGRLLAAFLLLLAAGIASAQSVIYREIFGNSNTASPASIDTAGWLLARGSTGLLDYATATSGLRRATFTGNPTNASSLNSSLNPSSTLSGGVITATSNLGSNTTDTVQATGYFIRGTASPDKSLIYTAEYSIDRSAQEIANINFYLGSSNVADTVRVAVQIASAWYVTSSTFANTAPFVATTPSTFQLQAFAWTTGATAWNNLSFTAGTTLSMGSALSTALPGGNITAFGLYYDTANIGTVSFDTYEIQATAIPEPGTYAVLAGVSALLVAGYARRRVERHCGSKTGSGMAVGG